MAKQNIEKIGNNYNAVQVTESNVLEPGPQGTPGVEAAAMNSNQSNNNW